MYRYLLFGYGLFGEAELLPDESFGMERTQLESKYHWCRLYRQVSPKEYERIDFYGYLVHIVQRLMNPKAGGKRKGILVFTRF